MFTKAAEMLGVPCKDCVVIEDSAAGIAAAAAGGMKSVGIGSSEILGNADRSAGYGRTSRIRPAEIAKITEISHYPLTFSSLSIYNEI